MTPTALVRDAVILGVEERAYKGKDGTDKMFRSVAFKVAGSFFKLSIGGECDILQLKDYAVNGETVDIVLSMSTFGDSITPDFRVAGIA